MVDLSLAPPWMHICLPTTRRKKKKKKFAANGRAAEICGVGSISCYQPHVALFFFSLLSIPISSFALFLHTSLKDLFFFFFFFKLIKKMAEEQYDGAIGIDLGTLRTKLFLSSSSRCPSLREQIQREGETKRQKQTFFPLLPALNYNHQSSKLILNSNR